MKPFVPDDLPLGTIDWTAHVSGIGRANEALGRYDGLLQSIVNSSVLLSPLTTQEAVLSSRIEGTQATIAEVLEFEADPNEELEPRKYADIREIINYRQAINSAVEELEERPICLNLLLKLHAILLDSVRGKDKRPGEFRRFQNYIGPAGSSIEDATFVPPSPENVLPALGNWEKYIHTDEKDRLVQLAVVKAQFEIIHPFLDGNGRIGRMLIPLFLYEKKLLSKPVFYLSAYLEANRDLYYQKLRGISQDGDWNGWITFFLNAVVEQTESNIEKVREIIDLHNRMKTRIPEIVRSSSAVKAIDALFDSPVFTTASFARQASIPEYGSRRLLQQLVSHGIVKKLRAGKGRRAAIYIFPDLLEIAK